LGAVKHLILDVNVIVDLWLEEGSAGITETLFREVEANGSNLWITAASLTTLDYVARRAFKIRGMPPEAVADIIPGLVEDLLARVRVLGNHGFEQLEIYHQASDFEDAQTSAAARVLSGQPVCIVTEDQTFDTLGEVSRKTPGEAHAWLLQDETVATQGSPIPFINLAAQQALIRPAIERGIETVLRHGQYIMGPEVGELEERLADFVGVKHCIGLSSGTDALLVAMMALEIGPGDEVITTPFTFIATGGMIALLGAKPVFVDIDPRTYNIDPGKIEAAITPRTRAIMPVSLYGQCADMDAINSIAGRHGLPVIEDGAQSLGATYKGRQSCGLSTIGCTSFFPSKPLGGYGDSGACFTNDHNLAKLMREIRNHGQDRRYHHPRIGINGRLDALQAAVLLPKLDLFSGEVELRAQVGSRYTKLIEQRRPEVTPPYVSEVNTSVYAQYTVLVNNREEIEKNLQAAGIPTAVHYPVPLNKQPALQTDEFDLSIAERISTEVISLPMHPYLERDDQERVVEALL